MSTGMRNVTFGGKSRWLSLLTTVPFVVLMTLTWPVTMRAAEEGNPDVVDVGGTVSAGSGSVSGQASAATDTPLGAPTKSAAIPTGSTLAPAEPISVGAGESVVLAVTDALRVAVAEPKVADVAVVSRTEVLLSGRAPGETTLHIWDKSGLRTLGVRVFENTTRLVNEIKGRLNLPDVTAWMHQGTVVLEGQVDSLAEKQRAIQVAGAYGKVVDLLTVRVKEQPQAAIPVEKPQTAVVDPSVQDAKIREQLTELGAMIADSHLRLRIVNGALLMDGSLADTQAQERARRLAALYFPQVVDVTTVRGPVEVDQPELAARVAAAIDRPGLVVRTAGNRMLLEGTLKDQNELSRAINIAGGYGKEVVNMVALTAPLQVALKVHVLEIDKTGEGELGVAWGSLNRGVLDTNAFYIGELNLDWQLQRLMLIGAKIQTLVEDGHAKILAAPTLLTMSGETASFLAGGEIPVAMPQGENKYVIEWKQYGVQLQMKPTVDARGYVTVSLSPEVSTLDWANAIRISTIALPALRTRRTQTQVMVEDGATLVLGGLLNREESKQATKMPLLAELPVLGRLFRSEKFSNGETQLLFLVTPQVLKEGQSLKPEVIVSPGLLTGDKKNNQPKATVLDMLP